MLLSATVGDEYIGFLANFLRDEENGRCYTLVTLAENRSMLLFKPAKSGRWWIKLDGAGLPGDLQVGIIDAIRLAEFKSLSVAVFMAIVADAFSPNGL